MTTPRIVLDTETTGYPNGKGGYCGRIIEVGAVVITEDCRVVSQIEFFVRQPKAHLESWQARQAQKVHGIRAGTILTEGLEPEVAAERFAGWVAKVRDRFGVEHVVAFNQGFDFWFLARPPWDLFERTGLQKGEDVMLCARRGMGLTSGPGLKKASEAAGIPWLSSAHRAGEDARMAALVALHFEAVASAGAPVVG